MVLAAGTATRFGSTKQVASADGRPLVAHVVAAACTAGLHPVLVVVGHDADVVTTAARTAGPVQAVVNPDFAAGQSTSLRAGIAAAQDRGLEGVVVLLADEPDVTADAIAAVASAVGPAAPVVRARYDDGPGHPVGFHRSWFTRLRAITGDRGARELLRAAEVRMVVVPGRRPVDVDTPEGLPHRTGRGPDDIRR